MSVANSHQITRYYDYFRDKEVIFTKANLRSLRIDPRQIYLKCSGGQWPCIINSTSLQMAKVIIGTSSGIYGIINKKRDIPISIRYCFIDQNNSPIPFFVNCVVSEIKQYQGSNELALVTLSFTQRPCDDLIDKIGEFVEVNENFRLRKEERIAINKNSMRELGIQKEESVIYISNVPRRCIVKDISFGGARIMLVGVPKFLQDKLIDFRMFFTDTNEQVSLKGTIVNAAFLEGRQDIAVINIQYSADDIPMPYKFHINRYITSYQKKLIENQMKNTAAQEKAAAEEEKRLAEKKAAQEKRIADEKNAAIAEKKAQLLAKIQNAKSTVQNNIDNVKQSVEQVVEEKKAEVEQKVEAVKENIANVVDAVKDKIDSAKAEDTTDSQNS